METVAQRIKELIDKEGLSNTEFAKKININPSIISHILSGRNKPSLQLIEAVKSSFTNVNLDYLISGNGTLYSNVINVKSLSESTDHTETSDNPLFPMEGVRHASIPGTSTQTQMDLPPSVEEKTPPTPAPQESNSLPLAGDPDAIEQIVIFYKDGRFKAYRP